MRHLCRNRNQKVTKTAFFPCLLNFSISRTLAGGAFSVHKLLSSADAACQKCRVSVLSDKSGSPSFWDLLRKMVVARGWSEGLYSRSVSVRTQACWTR